MAQLTWYRKETNANHSPKVLELIAAGKWRAVVVWDTSIAYSRAHGTNGFIHKAALPLVHGTAREARDLVAVGLWDEDKSSGGWAVHDYLDFQFSSSEDATRAERIKKRGRKGNCLRWHGPHCGCWESDQ